MGAVQNSLKCHKEKINKWSDISALLTGLKHNNLTYNAPTWNKLRKVISQGVAFITYDFGIDGVSIEIAKYANCLEQLFPNINLHFVGGDFHKEADKILKPNWNRLKIDDFNGWNKWSNGEIFRQLFYEKMPIDSEVSQSIAKKVWQEAYDFAVKLGDYLEANQIKTIIPVNVPTNPGNMAAMLAIVMVSELLNLYVISSNHDFYWEGGHPASEISRDIPPGPRDHFFKNCNNYKFFTLFENLYPWNGKKWLQVNINKAQSRTLIDKFKFNPKKVFELGTAISDDFFIERNKDFQKSVRQRMNFIIGNGHSPIITTSVDDHLNNLSTWMRQQSPIAIASETGIELDLTAPNTLYCLQPTRVISRKRIELDVTLFQALLGHSKFIELFTSADYKLILHITGPTPIEHENDLRKVLKKFKDLCDELPKAIAKRIFIVFSVGNEEHPCFKKLGLKPLSIESIYQLADIVLFPSETEGRGLPIIEASAGGVPIVCSRYYPEEVFAEVVGENLSIEEQIRYILFPTTEFSKEFLDSITTLLFCPGSYSDVGKHNQSAVKSRYGSEALKHKILYFLQSFCDL